MPAATADELENVEDLQQKLNSLIEEEKATEEKLSATLSQVDFTSLIDAFARAAYVFQMSLR